MLARPRTPFFLLLLAISAASADFSSRRRGGRQFDQNNGIIGNAIDFSQATFDEDSGKMCVIKEEEVQSLEKEPVLECTHKNIEKCHYTYVTEFSPTQEEVCDETFEKKCQITFKQQAVNETVKKCYMPLQSVCNGQGADICETLYETSCTTRYIEKQPGKFVGDTKCEKLPLEICGAGCVVEEGPEECHDKTLTSLIDVPEEVCDLNPQKVCRFQTRLVPSLKPKHECTIIPQEVCNLRFTTPKLSKKPLITKWCLDDSPVVPDETYDESQARGQPIAAAASNTYETSVPQNPFIRNNKGSNKNNGGGRRRKRPNPRRRQRPQQRRQQQYNSQDELPRYGQRI